MVHYGKHIIDPQTGLCEICDRGAIHDFQKGKRPGRQFLYSNQNGKFTYRPNNGEMHYHEETPRRPYVRKPLYPEPPSDRPRRIVHEEPAIVQKKVIRRTRTPPNDFQRSPAPHPATMYYVDNTGQMSSRSTGPPEEPRQHYLVQNHQSPPARPARVVHRRAQTPPPPASETWRSPPRRENNSDTEIIGRQQRLQPNDSYYYQSPRKSEMYHIDSSHYQNGHSTISSLVQKSTPSPRNFYQGDTNRKQRQLEPIERKHYNEPEPTVVRKVYRKLPPHRYEPPEEEYIPNGNHGRPVRKIEKIYPTPKQYESSPQLTKTHGRSPLSDHRPTVYYIPSVNEYY